MRKHNYVVGYKREGECVYGISYDKIGDGQHTQPMTLNQAIKARKKTRLSNGGDTEIFKIFKLVEVK